MKSKRGALRFETYLSTEPPAPGENARLSHSYEDSWGAQCAAAPPSEEPSSLDSLKRLFDLSSFPQDFSAATPKRVSAGLRRRTTPQRITMHGILPAQWLTALTFGHHHADASGECCLAQSPATPPPRSVPAESCEPSGRVGLPGESSRSGREGVLHNAPAGTAAAISTTASTAAGGLLKLLALGLIRFYQACLSPTMPLACRYYPSCSAYAYEAVEKWGVWKGARLATARLLRCRPWGRYGYDPVP
jgi:uncharacterized protein